MAQRGPPFDFDLNEQPPEDDGASDASPAWAPEPVREPSPRDLLPPPPQDTLHPSPQHDSLPPPAPASARDPTAPDSLPAADPVLAPVPLAPDPMPAPVPESSPHDPLPAPTPEPSPSPVLDLEAPLSSLDDDDDEYDYDEADLPPPPPLPPFGLPVAAAPARSSSSVDTPHALPASPNRYGERTSRVRASQDPIGDTARLSSLRGPSRAASGATSPHRSRRRPYSYDPRDDAISKHRCVDYDEDAGSSRSGSRRSGSPRRYERPELAPPHQYEQDGGRHAPAAHGQTGAPPRNRRRRRRRRPQRPQDGYQYQGPVQKQQGRGREQEQGFRGHERPQAHQGYHGPHGPEVPKVGYSSDGPLYGSFSRFDGRPSPEREPINGNGGYQQRRESPPFRPSSRPHGREDPYQGRRSQAQGPPKIGGYQPRWEAPSLRPSSGAHGRDGSSGGRQAPAQEPINGGAYQQRKAPRGREHFPDRPYHPYARDGGAFDRTNGSNQARREPQPNYEHRRDSEQRTSGGPPARGRQYYGD